MLDRTIQKDAVDYVDPNIGGIGHLLTATMPVAALPHGMMQVSPVFTPSIQDRYLADKIYGFAFSGFSIMAAQGRYEADNGSCGFASMFDHDHECAAPYSYDVLLEDYDIGVEYTVTERVFLGRVSYPESEDSNLILDFLDESGIEVSDSQTIRCRSVFHGIKSYLHLTLSKPFDSYKIITTPKAEAANASASGDRSRIMLKFSTSDREAVEIRAGVSYISCEQALTHLECELGVESFDHIKEHAKFIWNQALNKIKVKGGSEKQRTIFYTALYRSLLRPCDISEGDYYFSGYDQKVHETEGQGFYVNDGLWDTYRSMHPLQLMLEPERRNDIIKTYLSMYKQSGWLPSFPFHGGDLPIMIGDHAVSVIFDAYQKGFKDFDLEKAYEAMKKTSLNMTKLPWALGPANELDQVYHEKGFFPALAKGQQEWVPEVHSFERRQAVAVTLEAAYDDWCIAQTAKMVQNEADYQRFSQKAENYQNLYNPETGFISPKSSDGKWVEDFDPKLSGGQGGREYFAECNSWIFSFHVQHDIEGLMSLMGGKKKFEERLDALFVEQYGVSKYEFLKQFPDATGLIGQYCQGNEPSFHIPYLYNYAGTPWKTQRKLREIMKIWYGDGPLGICGDEDGGAMSSWYVFSAMGFYPVCPGKTFYDIGSPLFEETAIQLSDTLTFTIKAENVSDKNKYIQSAYLNGEPLNKPWFNHSDIACGGSLVLVMGDRPNKAWGC